MSDTLSNKQMDAAVEVAEADTQRVINEQLRAPMSKQQMQARIRVLSDEMDANDEENRQYQSEIDALYKQIDALK